MNALRWGVAVYLCVLLQVGALSQTPGGEISEETLRDKIRGGLLGQILGNLNGLPVENKFVDRPGTVTQYVPALPAGAWTDDDTDFEWVYLKIMQEENTTTLAQSRIAQLWRERINTRIWCANAYARYLMDLGLEPPLTGHHAINPWADFNISGQFLAECWGLMSPGMPRTAARIGLNYTHVAIDLEPAQTTQMFTTMIATAFFEDDINAILDAGLEALDPRSEINAIVADVRAWHNEHPQDWRATRQLMHDKYTQVGGAFRDINGHELNTAGTVAALLYGEGDFVRTLETAMNFGWDCDNNAATAGTIIGVIEGYRAMMANGWQIVDRYKNDTRDDMPLDETITSYADRIIDMAERVIRWNGGERTVRGGTTVFEVPIEKPAMIEALPNREAATAALRAELAPEIEVGIREPGNEQERARAAYLAIALDLAPDLKAQYPAQWAEAVAALSGYWQVMQNIFWEVEIPNVLTLREKATAVGLERPAEWRRLWE